MPKARNYTNGSIVFFQGDKAEDVFVLKSGRVILISNSVDGSEEYREEVKQGEFFGVKSCLGRYPREETAQVVGSTAVISFRASEFEQFIIGNTRLVMKMLRVFSKQLRTIHKEIRSILKVGAARDPAFELLSVAETFYKNGNIPHASYAFEKYLEYYPRGILKDRAERMLDSTKRNLPYPPGSRSIEEEMSELMASENGNSYDDTSDLFSMGEGGEDDLTSLFEKGLNLYEKGNYDGALEQFQQSRESGDKELAGSSLFQLGRTLLKMKKLDDASGKFTEYLKNYQGGKHTKESIYQLGIISEAKGNREKAKSLYVKVVSIPPMDETSRQAKSRVESMS